LKRFRFSLATVLKVKQRREEALKKELGSLQARRAQVQRNFKTCLSGRDELKEWQKDRRNQRIPAAMESWFQDGLKGWNLQIESLRAALAEMEAQCENKRLALVEAAKERKVFEKLEENQKKEYMLELSREEQGFLDELSQHRFLSRLETA
jgi:flagellar FliJ protein